MLATQTCPQLLILLHLQHCKRLRVPEYSVCLPVWVHKMNSLNSSFSLSHQPSTGHIEQRRSSGEVCP